MKKLLFLLTFLAAITASAGEIHLAVVKADWCGACKVYAPTIEKVRKSKKVKIQIIDSQKEKHYLLGLTRYLPTTFFFDESKLLARVSGAIRQNQLECIIDSLRKDSSKNPMPKCLGLK